MVAAAATEPEQRRHARGLVLLLEVASLAAAGGALTAFAQGWLPDEVGSLANSAGTWALVAFALALLAPRAPLAAGCAALALVALVLGYYVTNELRSFPASPRTVVFWLLAATFVGPVLGLAAYGVRRAAPLYAAVAAGVVAGVLLGEGVYGLRVIADTTYPPFWWAEIGAAALLLVVVWVVRRLDVLRAAASVLVAVTVAAVFLVVYQQDLLGLL